MFVFERGNAKPVSNPTAKAIARQLGFLRTVGRSSYASLTDEQGNWVQVGGGQVTCMLERKDAATGRIFRAWQDPPVVPVEFDQAILDFGAGEIRLAHGEWFQMNQAVEVFTAFLESRPFPEFVRWRDITSILFPESEGSPK